MPCDNRLQSPARTASTRSTAMATPSPARTCLPAALAQEVRSDTIQLLQAARPAELTWAPAGTSNHLLWHAGHGLWLQDVLCLRLLSGRSELPAGWEERFAMGSRP